MKRKINTDKTKQKQSRYRGLRPFKKGQSGNPEGRPKGTISIVAEIKKKFLEIPQGEKRTYLEIFLMKLFKKVLVDEDTAMMRDLIDRVDGKPKQEMEIEGYIESKTIEKTLDTFIGLIENAKRKRLNE